MLPFLFVIPLFVSIAAGVAFVLQGSARPATKWVAVLVFVLAVYLQFFTRHALAGMLLQVGLALALLLWRRFDSWM